MTDSTPATAATEREFKPGWLAPILQAALDEILSRPPEDRPRLTGERGRRLAAMGGWDGNGDE